MDRGDFDAYVDAVNRLDHQTLHPRFFAPDATLYTLGYALRGQQTS